MDGILIPQQVFIGDTAEFLYPIQHIDGNVNLNNIKSPNIQQNSQMTIHKIEIKKQDGKEFISISFTPWDTGNISFPLLTEFGIENQLPDVTIASILTTTKTEILQPPRPPMLIPGTTNLIYFIITIFVIFVFLLLFTCTTIRKKILVNYFSNVQKKRVRMFYKKLKKLQKKQKSKPVENTTEETMIFTDIWLKEFELAFKEYCKSIILNTTKHKMDISKSPTYTEILLNLKNEFNNSIDIYLEFKDLFLKLQKSRFQKSVNTNIKSASLFTHFINKSFYIIKISEEQIEKNKSKEKNNYDKI